MQNHNLHTTAALNTNEDSNWRPLLLTSLLVFRSVHYTVRSFFNPVQTLKLLHAPTSLKKQTDGQHLLLQHLGEGTAYIFFNKTEGKLQQLHRNS